MESEKNIEYAIKNNNDCIKKALVLMEKMEELRALLLIKKGAGQRYLQYTQPSQQQLQKAEQVIRSQYLPKPELIKMHKKSSFIQAMNQKGRA